MLSTELPVLLEQYVHNVISEEDFRRLWKSLHDPGMETFWHDAIKKLLEDTHRHGTHDPDVSGKALATLQELMAPSHDVPVVPFYRKKTFRYAAAVLVALAAAMSVWMSAENKLAERPVAAATTSHTPLVHPGGQKALLTLADGTVIELNDLPAGKIAEQGNAQVIKAQNGQLQYRLTDASTTGSSAFNTMSTPRGGQYQLILPDSSHVWLNAESSITYPVSFVGASRKVKISGEAYFEVAKDKAHPFVVETRQETVEVLGTNFNVNAYADEGEVKTTLLQGSVRIGKKILHPGQAFRNGKVVATDIEQDIAWKNGVFNFNDKDLSQVMRQLARWYDLDVSYPHGIPNKEYGGQMGRNLDLNQVLQGLQNSGVRLALSGRQLTIENE